MPVPATLDKWVRQLKQKRTIYDFVEDIHRVLMGSDDNVDYRRWLDAISDDQAIEGSMLIDDSKAAEIIRDYAKDNGIVDVANAKLAAVVRALKVVLRRYGVSRQERGDTPHVLVRDNADADNGEGFN